jgi:hypothetical protein
VIAAAKRRLLHVANGTCTTRLIEAAGLPGACSLWADPLYEGPVPGGLDDRQLLEVRMRFLAGPTDASAAWAGGDPSLDPANDMREWRAVIERDASYDELILWFEHDLFDQLNLIQLLSWIHDRLPVPAPVSLICIGSFEGRPAFKGLGELAPAELASLMDARQPVTDSQYRLARLAWLAFREPTPESLDQLRQEDTTALPYLAPALTRFLQEYPWTTDGLSRTERRVLELAKGGVMPLRTVFRLMHDGEQAYYVTDGSLAAIAETLARTVPPLLTFHPSDAEAGHALRGAIATTPSGLSVLSGQVDRIAACGIDRWLGGVHLRGRTVPWRWDDQISRIVSA